MSAPMQPAQCRQKHLPGKSVEDIGKVKKHHTRTLAKEVQNLIVYVRDGRHRVRGAGSCALPWSMHRVTRRVLKFGANLIPTPLTENIHNRNRPNTSDPTLSGETDDSALCVLCNIAQSADGLPLGSPTERWPPPSNGARA